MKYTYEYIENNIDTRFFKLYDQIEALKLQKEIKGIHNQNRIILNYALSDIYKNDNCYDEFFEHFKTLEEEQKRPFQLEIFKEVQNTYIQLDKKLVENNQKN